MKHLKHLFTALLLLCSTVVAAHDFYVDGIYYNITDATNKTVGVTYRGNSYSYYSKEYTGSVVIPYSVNYNGTTYRVTSIGSYAFYDCDLTSIVIPNSVTSIGNSAFYDCDLTSIVIPNSVTSIGNSAFSGCTGLTSIEIPNSVTSIGKNAFSGTAWYNNQPDDVVYAGKVLYDYKGTMPSKFIIKDGTLGIANGVFYNCTGLRSIEIPNSVTNIGDDAFYNCYHLTSITIPYWVTSIGKNAFQNCTGLTSVEFNAVDCTTMGGDVNYPVFEGCTALSTITIGKYVRIIPDYAFYGCSGLTSITIPNSVTSIGNNAFYSCTGLKTVINISNLTFSKGSTDYGSVALYATKVVNAPNGSVEGDFIWCNLNGANTLACYLGEASELTLPADYKGGNYVIGNEAFAGRSDLTSITIPNSVTSIETGAFDGCTSLKELRIEDGEGTLSLGYNSYDTGEGLFYNCPLETLYLGRNLSYGYPPFYNIKTLASVIIGNSVTDIGDSAFEGCTGLKTVYNFSNLTFHEGSYNYGYIAFYASDVYNFPNGSLEGDFLFSKPNGVYTLLAYLGNATEITLPADCNGENYVIGSEVFAYNETITSVVIPYRVTSIGEWAFCECTGLTSITIPNRVTSIGEGAFYGCTGLTSIVIPNNVKSIGASAFENTAWYNNQPDDVVYAGKVLYNYKGTMPENTSITIKDGTLGIADGAFYDCNWLTSITIPNSVTSIGEWAFEGCHRLGTVVNFSHLTFSKGSRSYGDIAYYADKVYNVPNGSVEGNFIFGENTHEYTTDDGLPGTLKGSNHVWESPLLPGKINGIRITVLATNGGPNDEYYNGYPIVALGELEFYDGSGARIYYTDSNVSTNSLEGTEGSLANLNDGDYETFYHSTWSGYGTTPNGYVYLDVKFPSEVDGVKIKMVGRNTTSLVPNHIKVRLSPNNYALKYYIGENSNVVLPAKYKNENYNIADYAFLDNKTITSVTIPDGVTSIGDYAFYDCTRLWTVVNLSNLPLSKGSKDYGYVAYYAYEVINSADISGISLDKSAATLVEGELLTLKATVKSILGSLSDMPVTWSTSNSSVATVKDGVVTAVAPGIAIITAKVCNYSASCMVSVGNFIPITSLEQLKNNALYYISQPHHTKGATSWAIDKGGKALKSNVDLGVELSSSDTRQQFAILSIDGGAKRYLYHVGEKKFINKDGSLGEKPVDAVYIRAGAFDNTFMFYFNNTHFINVGGSRQMIIDDWSTPDGGNSCTIVPVGEFDPTEVTGISLDKSVATLVEGELLTLKATVKSVLGSLSDMPVTWSTSNSSVATVKDGVVTAVAAGTATITATAGDYSATCVVTVEKKVIAVTGISLSESKVTLTEGETKTLVATVTPADATDKTVTWSTSNSCVATVKDGVVTAVAAGTATITATAGDYSATCVVTVEKKVIAVTGISLSESKVTLTEGETKTLVATVTPADATDKTVTWSTSNSSVATVKDGVVTAVAAGTATITAKAGGYSATCVVTVEEKVITVTGITLSETKVTLTEGETMTLIATVTPSNAVNKTVTWSTTNSKAATVKDGVVTAVAPGRTRITATAGGYSATCVVSVEKFNGITSLGQLKNNALYYISQPHHTKGATSWAVDKGGEALKSNVDLDVELSSSDTHQQFAILSIDGGATRYLYHAGEKKFINKDGSLGEKPVDAVNIEAGAFKYTFMFYFDDVHYINVDSHRHMTIDYWSTPDGGNSCTIVLVAEFDPEVALGIITGIEDVEDVDGEIVVYNLQGNRILDVDNLERGIYIVNGKKVFVK